MGSDYHNIMELLDDALKRKNSGHPIWKLFDYRVRSPEEARRSLPYRPVHFPENTEVLQAFLKEDTVRSKRVIYVHIPFCKKICRFCGYNRVPACDADLIASYVQALISQIHRWAKTPWAKAGAFDAVYFGGGTPTAIPQNDLIQILAEIKSAFSLAKPLEITVESRISDIYPDDIENLILAGVNRMSFGVQSFDTGVRVALGRIESMDRIVAKLNQVHNRGLKNLSVDLIYNLPNQNPDIFKKDLEMVNSLPITGCDIYPLVLFDRSLLKQEIDENKELQIPGIDAEYRYFSIAENDMSHEWHKYSPVHFGKPDTEKAVYVTARSNNFDVLALGTGAAGNIGELVYINAVNIPTYINDQQHGSDEHIMTFKLPGFYLQARKAYGLSEGAGADPGALSRIFSSDSTVFAKLEDIGLVTRDDNRLELTSMGRFWAGNISKIISLLIADCCAEGRQ